MTALDEQPRYGSVAGVLARSDVQAALAWIGDNRERFVADLIELSEIPAPTFAEERRAESFVDRLRHAGITEIERDAAGNVIARLGGPGESSVLPHGPAFLAHLDTVFLQETDVRVTRKSGRLYGPGIGDNAAGLAGLLQALQAIKLAGIELRRPVWVVASTAEEGLGDLKGARAAIDRLRDRVDCVVAIEGALLGRVTHEAVGSLRWQVRFNGPGGHSWHDFGRASAINAAAAAVAELGSISLPADPRTTYNVGRIEGGIGVNVIAAEATMLIDFRSTGSTALEALVREADAAIRRAAEREGVSVEVEKVGDRPAGSVRRDHVLVEMAAEVLRELGLEPRYEAASTDANVPLSQGIPAITVGITHGGGIHTEDEWIDIAPSVTGIRQLLLLAMILAG